MNKHKHVVSDAVLFGICALVLSLVAPLQASAESFYLSGESGGEKYGPYEYKDGEIILIGTKKLMIRKVAAIHRITASGTPTRAKSPNL